MVSCTVVLTLSACIYPYEPINYTDVGDGVGADVGDLQLRNAVMVTADEDLTSTVSLIFTVLNETDRDQYLEILYSTTVDCAIKEVVVPAHSQVTRGFIPGQEQLILTDLDTRAGALMRVQVSAGDATTEMMVPVLNGDQPQYAPLVPMLDDSESGVG